MTDAQDSNLESPPPPPRRPRLLNTDKWLRGVSTLLFVIGLVCIGYVLVANYLKKRELALQGNLNCVTTTQVARIEDDHMKGRFEINTSVQVLMNYYNCNDPKRGDVAWFRFAETISPVARLVVGLPGDRYALTEIPNQKGRWSIRINDQAVQTNDKPYYIESNTVPPLKTYELSRGGVLKPGEYILLSNQPPGLSDSSNLGLVLRDALVGKVVGAP